MNLANLTLVEWSIVVTIAGAAFAIFWWIFLRDDGETVAPKATIVGVHPSSPDAGGIRKLPIEDGAVEWHHNPQDPASEQTGVQITLDPNLAIGPGVYLADLSTGDVFRPGLTDDDGAGVTRIDGETLYRQRRLNSQDIWLVMQDSDVMRWMHLARYIPWVIVAWVATVVSVIVLVWKG